MRFLSLLLRCCPRGVLDVSAAGSGAGSDEASQRVSRSLITRESVVSDEQCREPESMRSHEICKPPVTAEHDRDEVVTASATLQSVRAQFEPLLSWLSTRVPIRD